MAPTPVPAQYVAVTNHGRGKDFSLFDESAGRRRVEQMGGAVIELPELDAAAIPCLREEIRQGTPHQPDRAPHLRHVRRAGSSPHEGP